MRSPLCAPCDGSGIVECDDCFPPCLVDCEECRGSGLAPITTIHATGGRL